MTARRSQYRYLSCAAAALTPAPAEDRFEFDESEVWGSIVFPEPKMQARRRSPRPARKPLRVKNDGVDRLPRSLPVNIPDWSKILGGECRRLAGDDEYGDEVEGEQNDRIPPHEYLARTRGASLSVHEGEGRTLKGRDLSRVRNAIWKQIGFED
ncbi:protein S40-4-like [Salvia miltiorrhiza]|uniref:protein S40-4-like n=1 Tax=Salvia miltiorrhiza TaxID=226208 RepID=UPI0025ABCD06|nr:protein S40-4-like [Salvia miltiorrhiza]